MDRFAIKNFKRFKELTTFDFSPITFFVGENNAGKSSVVKAILTFYNYLTFEHTKPFHNYNQKFYNTCFYFNGNYYAHVGTFGRALCNKSDEHEIYFELIRYNYKISVSVIEPKEGTDCEYGIVDYLSVYNISKQIEIRFNLSSDTIYFISKKDNCKVVLDVGSDWESHCLNFDSLLETFFSKTDGYCDKYDCFGVNNYTVVGRLEDLHKECEINNEDYEVIKEHYNDIWEISDDLFWHDHKTCTEYLSNEIEYIYSHGITQNTIYNQKETNDYYVWVIWNFAKLHVHRSSECDEFIRLWMKEFGIGVDYYIKYICGDAVLVKILDSKGYETDLSDKGMGAIRIMVLLFRLATIISSSNKNEKITKTIIIEEPEENLHPSYQSKLADMFMNVNKKYGYRFIIETHSEYLIRKTQVLVSKMENLSENPFKVYYFPDTGNPYEMMYREDGNFSNEFGKGFYDEANNLLFEII